MVRRSVCRIMRWLNGVKYGGNLWWVHRFLPVASIPSQRRIVLEGRLACCILSRQSASELLVLTPRHTIGYRPSASDGMLLPYLSTMSMREILTLIIRPCATSNRSSDTKLPQMTDVHLSPDKDGCELCSLRALAPSRNSKVLISRPSFEIPFDGDVRTGHRAGELGNSANPQTGL
jgi:hypothetical protein